MDERHVPRTAAAVSSPRAPALGASAGGQDFLAHTDRQLAQLRLAYRRWRIGQRTRCGLCLRERDRIADAFSTGHQHHQPVEPEGDSTVWRSAEFQGIEQEPELALRFFRVNAKQFN